MATDIVDAETRSRMMRAVRQRNTRPELAVRATLRELGVAYRVQNRTLPDSPDIANQRRGWVIFVNGCFWHGHRNCEKTRGGRGGRVPVANEGFWAEKLRANRRRDARTVRELRHRGLRVKIVWECELRRREELKARLARFIQGGRQQ